MNHAAADFCEQICVWTHAACPSRCVPRSGIARLKANSVFHILRKYRGVFSIVCLNWCHLILKLGIKYWDNAKALPGNVEPGALIYREKKCFMVNPNGAKKAQVQVLQGSPASPPHFTYCEILTLEKTVPAFRLHFKEGSLGFFPFSHWSPFLLQPVKVGFHEKVVLTDAGEAQGFCTGGSWIRVWGSFQYFSLLCHL